MTPKSRSNHRNLELRSQWLAMVVTYHRLTDGVAAPYVHCGPGLAVVRASQIALDVVSDPLVRDD